MKIIGITIVETKLIDNLLVSMFPLIRVIIGLINIKDCNF